MPKTADAYASGADAAAAAARNSSYLGSFLDGRKKKGLGGSGNSFLG